MQLEIIELQSSTVLKCKYKEASEIIEFWKCLPEEDFLELHDVALKLVCRFGSTYICEKCFSRMTFIKNKYRTKLINSHLKNLMLLSSTKLKPNYDNIHEANSTYLIIKKKTLQLNCNKNSTYEKI